MAILLGAFPNSWSRKAEILLLIDLSYAGNGEHTEFALCHFLDTEMVPLLVQDCRGFGQIVVPACVYEVVEVVPDNPQKEGVHGIIRKEGTRSTQFTFGVSV